jgi:putative CocE/NonD family hydrolase
VGASQTSSETGSDRHIIMEDNVMVPARDGIGLATDIYRPANAVGPVPVILERTPYDKSADSHREVVLPSMTPMSRAEFAAFFVQRGYAVAFQDCRGRYHSEGVFAKYITEGDDGFDTVEWLKAQPWCDGRIITNGLSYAAHTQTSLASLAPTGIAAMLIDSGGSSEAFHSGIRQGGAFEMKQVTWAFNQAYEAAVAKGDQIAIKAHAERDLKEWFKCMPWKKGHSAVSHVPDYEEALFRQWTAGNYDEYWRKVGHYAYYENFPNVPTVVMASWYDAWVQATIDHYEGMRARNKGPLSLIVGPWLHGQRSITHAGDVDFGPRATFDGNVADSWLQYRLDWVNRFVLEQRNGIDEEKPVKLFLMGGGSGRKNADGRFDHGGEWIQAPDWPVPGTDNVHLYFHADGSLSQREPDADVGPLSYQHDPKNPVPTIGGALQSGEPIFAGGAYNQIDDARFFGCTGTGIPLAARHDILVFQTDVLKEDVAIVGPMEFELWVTSDCPDTDFTAKLVDVAPANEDYPNGFALNITNGIIRCRYRNSWEKPEPIAEGEIFKVTIKAFPTANLFKAGHRIRIDIASSNFPHFDVNTNTYEPEGLSTRTRISTNSVFVDAHRPSRANVSVLKVDCIEPFLPRK